MITKDHMGEVHQKITEDHNHGCMCVCLCVCVFKYFQMDFGLTGEAGGLGSQSSIRSCIRSGHGAKACM